jgi:hypothetical protein
MVRRTGPRSCAWTARRPGPIASVPAVKTRLRLANAMRAARAARAERVLFIFFVFVRNNCVILIIIALSIDWGELQWVAGDDLEIAATLVALNQFAFFDVVDIDVQGVIAFWAYN